MTGSFRILVLSLCGSGSEKISGAKRAESRVFPCGHEKNARGTHFWRTPFIREWACF
jgi:hypothetical protein